MLRARLRGDNSSGRVMPLRQAFNALVENIEEFAVEQTRDLQQELFSNIRRDNPVDTGASQRAWEISEEVRQLGDIGVNSNDKEYVIYLEQGSSTQAPTGFIQNNITRSLNERNNG